MPKAKELRPFVERLITIAKRGVAGGRRQRQDAARAPAACSRSCRTATSSASCSTTLAPRFAERPGGYTRILRVGFRRGDSAEVAHVELVGSEYNPSRRGREGRREAEAPKSRRASAIASSAPRSGSAAGQGRARRRPKGQAQGGQTQGAAQQVDHAAQGRRLARVPSARRLHRQGCVPEVGNFEAGTWNVARSTVRTSHFLPLPVLVPPWPQR